MQTYVLLALAGFLFALVATAAIGTLLRRTRPTSTSILPLLAVSPQPARVEETPAVLPFDDSALADETQPVRPIAAIEFTPLIDVAHQRVDTLTVLADNEDAADPDQISLLIEPDDEPSPQQRNVRRLIAYFREKSSTAEAAAVPGG